MVCIYFTNCFGWHAKKTLNGIQDKTFNKNNELTKKKMCTWTLYKVSKTQLECILNQGSECSVQRKEKAIKLKNHQRNTLILYHLCVSHYSFFLHHWDVASISVFYNPLKFISLDIMDFTLFFLLLSMMST